MKLKTVVLFGFGFLSIGFTIPFFQLAMNPEDNLDIIPLIVLLILGMIITTSFLVGLQELRKEKIE